MGTTTKHLLVLANSIKKSPGVCIAGREVSFTGSSYSIGPWIRPVSGRGEGELSPSETRLVTGEQPMVMDFIAVPLLHAVNDPLQPENWLIDAKQRWNSVNSSYSAPPLELLAEMDEPKNIWLQRGFRTDRVSATYLQKSPPDQSLYLIYVAELRARLEWKIREGRYKRGWRALFNYRGVDYDLSITDPVFRESFSTQFPPLGQPDVTIIVGNSNGCYLCVSLAPEFNRYHYKVVATIIEIDF